MWLLHDQCMIRTSGTQRYYASPTRKLVWIILAILLTKASFFYINLNLYFASAVALLWLAFIFSWIYHLFRTPIATTSNDRVILLERLRFGRPNFITLCSGQLINVTEQHRGVIELSLRDMGERRVNLKYLAASDRAFVIAALRRLTNSSDE